MNRKRKAEAGFTKEQLAASERYRDKKDLILALLEDGRCYSIQEADAKVKRYQKGVVR